MLLFRHGVRSVSDGLVDASSLVCNFSCCRGKLLRVTFHSPLADSQRLLSSTSSLPFSQTNEKVPSSPIGREAYELSKFIDNLCNPNSLNRRANALFTRKQIAGMNVAADSFLDSLNLSKHNISKDAIPQFGKEVHKMSGAQLCHLLRMLYNRKIDNPALLNYICTALNDRPLPPSLLHTSQIVYLLSKLSFLNKPLLNKIREHFMTCVQNEIVSAMALSHVAIAFAFFRLTDRRFWQELIRTAETLANRSELDPITLIHCINSLAMANVHPKLVASVVERSKALNKDGMFPGKWLQFVHSLTILNSLDAQIAEGVLNRRFFEHLTKTQGGVEISDHLLQWNAICYRNIGTSVRLELPKDRSPPVDDALFANDDPKSFSLVRDIKRGDQKHHPLLGRFELMLRLVAPLNSHSTPQEWHKTGAFLEGRCFVDTTQRQLIPLKDAYNNSNAAEIAVLLLMDRHFTQSFSPTDEQGPDRPTGINQMNIRHLKLAGIHPVVFTERHFRELGDDERSQVKFIRDKIVTLSEEFHTNEWEEG